VEFLNKLSVILQHMKKILLLSVVCLSLTGMTFSQPQLSFRMTRPVIYHSGGNPGADYFRFDLEVMASATGTYLWSGQAQFTFDNTTLSTTLTDWTISKGTLLTGTNEDQDNMYSTGKSLVVNGPYEFYCNWYGDVGAKAYGGNPLDFNEVPTTWTQLAIIRAKVTSNTGMAGIDMHESVFNGNESYLPSGSSTITPYADPNAFDTRDFTACYVQRIFNSFDGWTGCGVSTASSLTKASLVSAANWQIVANTSIWDTSTAAATIDYAGSLANALRIYSYARLKISTTKDLTCSGATEINGVAGLVIAADNTGKGQFIDNGTITYPNSGTARADCYFAQQLWHYIAIPVQSTNVVPYHNLYMTYYQEPVHQWKWVVSPGTMDTILQTPMQGFAIWSDTTNPRMGNSTVKVYGSLNTGSLSIPISRTLNGGSYDGYNQVGNPYVSAIDLSSSGVTWNNVDQKAWFYSSGSYTVYIKAGGGTRVSSFAAPQQGFFVHHTEVSSSGSLAFNNTVRTINSETFLKNTTDNLPDYLLLTAAQQETANQDLAAVYFRDDASAGYDEMYDAGKMWGDAAFPQLYTTIPDYNLTVNALKWTSPAQVVPLAFLCGINGTFTITASDMESFRQGTTIILEDKKENIFQSLIQNPVYTFSYQTTDDPNRFLIHFNNPYLGVKEQGQDQVQVYSWEDVVYVKHITSGNIHGTITLYNLTGVKVFEAPLENVILNKFRPSLIEGYYVARVQTDNATITTKVFLNQD